MNVSQALFSELKATAAITALSSYRIYPLAAAQEAKMPYIVYQQISESPNRAMVKDPKITSYRFQVSARSTSYSSVINLSTQIKTALRDKTGTFGTSNFNVQRIFFDGAYDYPENDPATEQVIFNRASDFIIWTTGG